MNIKFRLIQIQGRIVTVRVLEGVSGQSEEIGTVLIQGFSLDALVNNFTVV